VALVKGEGSAPPMLVLDGGATIQLMAYLVPRVRRVARPRPVRPQPAEQLPPITLWQRLFPRRPVVTYARPFARGVNQLMYIG
jgi:hypothetical protein